jgi:hypothetical protein
MKYNEARKWAEDYCARHGLRYLSHEHYVTMTTEWVFIAVEDGTGRYEVRCKL